MLNLIPWTDKGPKLLGNTRNLQRLKPDDRELAVLQRFGYFD
jgi:hypothetical protein